MNQMYILPSTATAPYDGESTERLLSDLKATTHALSVSIKVQSHNSLLLAPPPPFFLFSYLKDTSPAG